MKNKNILTKILALALVVLMAAFTFAACGKADTNSDLDSTASEIKTISITVTVVAADKTEKVFNIETTKKNLGDALFEEGLVTEDEHKSGYYNYIDGVRADYTKDGAWWCFTKGGETVMVGANDLKITDGDKFEITNTPA
ncbi:MAG: DUF4430 domain-containing protein [Clostridia bacterium]|nr:DUF4430 domain-containing protein [Clostridia bacterium]